MERSRDATKWRRDGDAAGDATRTSDQSKALFAATSPVAVAVGHCRRSDRVRNSVMLTKFLTDGGGGVFSMVLRRRATGRAKRRGSRHASFLIPFLFSDKSCPTMAV